MYPLESLRAATVTYRVKFGAVAAFKDSGVWGRSPHSKRSNGALPYNGPSGWGRAQWRKAKRNGFFATKARRHEDERSRVISTAYEVIPSCLRDFVVEFF